MQFWKRREEMPHLSPAKHLIGGPEDAIPKKSPMAARWSGARTSTCNGNHNKKSSDSLLFFPGFLEFDEDRCNGTGIDTPFGQFCEPAYIMDVRYLKAYQKAKTERYDHNCEITDRVNHGPLPLHPNTRVSS